MPKMKTFKSASKRFRVTGTGKIFRHSAYRRHLLTKKDRGRKRANRAASPVSHADAGRIRRMIPYA